MTNHASRPLAIALAVLTTIASGTAAAQHDRLGLEGATAVERGRNLFDWVWEKTTLPAAAGRADGLGPMFNARSCSECHHQGGSGGSGSNDRNIDIVTARPADFGFGFGQVPAYAFSYSFRFVNGRFEYRFGNGNDAAERQARNENLRRLDPALLATVHEGFRQSPSVVLHKFSTDPTWREYRRTVPGSHGDFVVEVSHRNTPSLFGTGLIETLKDEVLVNQAGRQRLLGMGGRVARTADGRVGKFGWKGQKATLRDFVEEAAAGELGLETPNRHQGADPRGPAEPAPAIDLGKDQIDSITAFVASLPRPEPDESASSRSGQRLFRELECTKCHVPNLGGIEGIYADLLLHDMKPEIRESGQYQVFGTSTAAAVADTADSAPRADEWRTPPLWGIRNSAPYMHDGRAAGLDEAILEHGGEAEASARKYARLSDHQRDQLIRFLRGL
jgi:CxxC motif-containing protein (DUF1111 family)